MSYKLFFSCAPSFSLFFSAFFTCERAAPQPLLWHPPLFYKLTNKRKQTVIPPGCLLPSSPVLYTWYNPFSSVHSFRCLLFFLSPSFFHSSCVSTILFKPVSPFFMMAVMKEVTSLSLASSTSNVLTQTVRQEEPSGSIEISPAQLW
ncbi:hypothetical protein QOT17_009255 [Balamuthia mandrillaris]